MSQRPGLDASLSRLLAPLGADGIAARTALFEDVRARLDGWLTRQRQRDAEVLRIPPVVSRRHVERSGYLSSFPQLLGSVCALTGSEADIGAAVARHEQGGDWTLGLSATELVLTPAACYPIYPLVASRGPVPAGGLQFDVTADCFRREPSPDPDRLQSFRMREFVSLGNAASVVAFRSAWMARAEGLAGELGLAAQLVPATDPFFGRLGQLRGVVQQQQALKFELLAPVRAAETPTACMSFNYHQDHFGAAWGLQDEAGGCLHTACVAFGMDRLVLALFAAHGPEPHRWPDDVRRALEFTTSPA